MKAYELQVQVTSEGHLDLPKNLLKALSHEENVKMIILVPESSDMDWSREVTEQFFEGYSDLDSVYDGL